MGRPILRLATRLTRRTRWTAWAIAFACMVLVGSLNLVDGLSAGVDSVTARFTAGSTLYLRGSDLLASAVDEGALAAIPTDYAVLRVHAGDLSVNGVMLSVLVASLTDYHDGNASTPFPADSRGLALDTGLQAEIASVSGAPANATANLSLFGLPTQEFPVDPAPASRPSLFPDTWVWVRPELLLAMSPTVGGPAQAVLTPSPLDAELATRLGLSPLQTVGALGFTVASVQEARSILLGLGVVLAAVIGLLAYTSLGLEVHLRREEIRNLRSLGAGPSTVAAVYAGQALVLALVGATLGSALGIVVAHAVVSFAPLLGFANLILPPLPLVPVALAYVLAIGAAGLGGLTPVLRAARLARSAVEVRPS